MNEHRNSSRKRGRGQARFEPAESRDRWLISYADLVTLLLALFSTLIPFALFYAGLRRLPATQTGILATAEPVIAVVSAALFLGESLGFMQNVGAVMVLAASAMTSARDSTSSRRESPDRSATPRTPKAP